MGVCSACGGGMLVYSRSHGKRRAFFYACPRARVGLCRNDLEARMEMADAVALGLIADDALAPETIELALDKLIAMMDAPAEDVDARRARLTEALRRTERELANVQAAIALGEPPQTLVAGLRDGERRKQQIEADLRALDAGPAIRAQATEVRSDALRLLHEWRGLLGKQVATSCQLLRKLLDRERFVFYPMGKGVTRWYEIGVTPTLEKFFASVPLLKKAGTSPMSASWNQVAAWLKQIEGLRRVA